MPYTDGAVGERYAVTTDSYLWALLVEVNQAEQALAQAKQRLIETQAAHDVAAVKFAALRDAATEHFSPFEDNNPYLHPEQWPTRGDDWGKFKFARMNAGEAAVLVLMATGKRLTAYEIMHEINTGGGRVDMRALNAALQQRNGIVKAEGVGEEPATYWHVSTESERDIEPDDLPF